MQDETRTGESGYGPTGVRDLVDRARALMTVERVYGEPVERDGVTVIPAAAVRGGGGGGGGGGENARGEEGSGEGLGFGLTARPVGAYVITDGSVRWEPAFDLTRIVHSANGVAVAALAFWWLVRRSSAKASVKIATSRS